MKSTASKVIAKMKMTQSTRGQSLVEMAIITPLLIFMLIGLFEVGWALRGYLTLVNANREITRFAVRPNYLDYSAPDPALPDYGVGYEQVQNYLFTTLSDQLELNLDQNGTLIISHMVIDTGWPCAKEDIGGCECEKFDMDSSDYDPNYGFTYDDLIQYPGKPGFDLSYSYIYTYPVSTTYRSRIDFAAEADRLAAENNKFNCELLKKTNGTAPVSANNLVTTELFFGQRMLFGFPLISNPFTDPVPMYTHTTMRVPGCPRSSNNCDTVGPVCDAYPIIIHDTTVDFPNNTYLNQRVDIFDGNGPPDFGWLAWNPDDTTPANTSNQYLRSEMRYSRTAINDYTNARIDTDHELTALDWIASIPGDKAAVEASDGLLRSIVGQPIRIPVWDRFDPGGGSVVSAYRIAGFAWVRIDDANDIDLPGKEVIATYLGEANRCGPYTP
jgi:hypothetical protein